MDEAEAAAVVALWERCGLTRPWNDPWADIALARRTATSAVLVGREAGAVAATVMVGCDGHRGWVYYLAVEPGRQGSGLGRAMMAAAEAFVQAAGAPKIQLMVRAGNAAVIGFYRKLGYLTEDIAVLGRRFDGQTGAAS
jgi:hypothetical protein